MNTHSHTHTQIDTHKTFTHIDTETQSHKVRTHSDGLSRTHSGNPVQRHISQKHSYTETVIEEKPTKSHTERHILIERQTHRHTHIHTTKEHNLYIYIIYLICP